MAHMEKFKLDQVAPLIRHVSRANASYSNENIDPDRTALNYSLIEAWDPMALLQDGIGALKRKPRRDAVAAFSWVITAPRDLRDGDSRAFFESAYRFVCNLYGEANLICAEVHRDETTDHAHFVIMPITADGRLCAKEVLNRAHLRAFHGDLSRWVERDLGYRVSVLLDEAQRGDRALSSLGHEDYKAAKTAIAEASERLERLQAEEAGLAGDVARIERGVREAGERAQALRGYVATLWERLAALLSPAEYVRARREERPPSPPMGKGSKPRERGR